MGKIIFANDHKFYYELDGIRLIYEDNQQLVNDIKYVLEHLNDVTLTTKYLSTKRRYVTFIDSPKIKDTIGVMWFG